jgi:hypothetical protein
MTVDCHCTRWTRICVSPSVVGGPGSIASIVTGYGLDGPGIEFRWGARFFAPVQTGPAAHPASCTTGTGSFPGVKSGRGVTLTPHPLLVPWSWMGRAISLLPPWAVRPVQRLSTCTRVDFILPLTSVVATGCSWGSSTPVGWDAAYCTSGMASVSLATSLCNILLLCCITVLAILTLVGAPWYLR